MNPKNTAPHQKIAGLAGSCMPLAGYPARPNPMITKENAGFLQGLQGLRGRARTRNEINMRVHGTKTRMQSLARIVHKYPANLASPASPLILKRKTLAGYPASESNTLQGLAK